MKPLEARIAEVRSAIAESCPTGVERRDIPVEIAVRELEDDAFTFEGHAAVFDQLSEDLGGWRERIKRGAFKRVLGDDVRFLVNHDPSLLLARTRNGTLRLKENPTGLHTEADIAPTTIGKDLRILVERQDLTQMSFAFMVAEAEWDDEDGELIRTVTRMEALYDVSAVTYPAYPQTDAGARKDLAAAAAQTRDDSPIPSSASLSEEEQELEADVARRESDGPSDEPQVSDEPDEPEQEGAWRLAGRQRRLRQRTHAL
jgi:HK97 family phage prohead protease